MPVRRPQVGRRPVGQLPACPRLAASAAALLCCGLCPSPAPGQEILHSFKTAGDAILCLTADMLPQALEAAKTKDRGKLDELGCFPIFAGVDATRVDKKTGSPVWEVRLQPKGGEPMTVWGYHHSFRSDTGAKIDKDGRPEK